jgi:hypothetical protein
VVLPESSGASLETLGALECAIANRSSNDATAPIFPAKRAVHREIEGPKTLSAFGRTPHRNNANSRNQPLHEMGRSSSGLQLIEWDERKAERVSGPFLLMLKAK